MASEQDTHNWLVNFGLEYHSGFSVDRSVVEHWPLKPSMGSSPVSWWLFFKHNDIIRIFIVPFSSPFNANGSNPALKTFPGPNLSSHRGGGSSQKVERPN